MANKTKLELTWIGKENRPKLEPRILLEEPGKSYHEFPEFPGISGISGDSIQQFPV